MRASKDSRPNCSKDGRLVHVQLSFGQPQAVSGKPNDALGIWNAIFERRHGGGCNCLIARRFRLLAHGGGDIVVSAVTSAPENSINTEGGTGWARCPVSGAAVRTTVEGVDFFIFSSWVVERARDSTRFRSGNPRASEC
jgi:hypothetical protein